MSDKKERLNQAYNYLKNKGIVHTQKDVAERMGASASNVSSALKGVDTVLTEKFLRRFNESFGNIFYNEWLLTGEGEMLNETADIAVSNEPNGNAKQAMSEYETYLLPMSSIGGSLVGLPTEGTMLEQCERVISPIKGVDFAISIYGESMYPEYPSGARVLIKRVNPDVFIEWGKVYVLDTSNGVIIKEIHQSPREGFITCHSINPDPKFADFDVPVSEIYGMYRVLMCLSAK